MKKRGVKTTYDPKIAKKVSKYLSSCQDIEDHFVKSDNQSGSTYQRILRVNLPTIEGFAKYIGYNKTTLYDWEKKYKEKGDEHFVDIANALEEIRTEQHRKLINSGLSGDYNSTIAKLMLMNNHEYKNRTDHTTNDKDITPTPILGDVPKNNSNKKNIKAE